MHDMSLCIVCWNGDLGAGEFVWEEGRDPRTLREGMGRVPGHLRDVMGRRDTGR